MKRGEYLTDAVTSAVNDLKQAKVEELERYFPGFERGQLQKALQNARNRGLIKLGRRGIGGPGNREKAVWCALQVEVHEEPEGRFPHGRRSAGTARRPVSSVWDLGACV